MYSLSNQSQTNYPQTISIDNRLYKFIKLIGKGKSSNVYLYMDPVKQHKVAVKLEDNIKE